MVPLAAPPVEMFAAGRAHHVHLAVVGHGLQRPVDGGQADPIAAHAQHGVQFLGAVEPVHPVQQGRDRAALPGVALGRLGLGHCRTSLPEQLAAHHDRVDLAGVVGDKAG
jgi:hypothetical protein